MSLSSSDRLCSAKTKAYSSECVSDVRGESQLRFHSNDRRLVLRSPKEGVEEPKLVSLGSRGNIMVVGGLACVGGYVKTISDLLVHLVVLGFKSWLMRGRVGFSL